MSRFQMFLFLLLPLAFVGCYQDRNDSIKLMNDGIALIKSGNTTDGLRALKKAYEVDPTNHRAMYFEGMALVQGVSSGGDTLNDVAQKRRVTDARTAEESLRGAIKLKDDDAEYHYQLGRALVAQSKHEAAISAFSKAVDLDPGHGKSLHRWARSLETLKRDNDAQEKYREALTKNPEHCHAFHDLGQLYVRYEEFNHAAKVFRNGTTNCPEFAPNFGGLGFVYGRIENWREAIKPLEKATKIRSRTPNPAYFLSLALSYRAIGETNKAIRAFKTFVMNSKDAAKKNASIQMKVEYAQDLIAQLESQ